MKNCDELSHSEENAFNKRKNMKRRPGQAIDISPLKTKRKLFNGIELQINGKKRRHSIDMDGNAYQKPLTERQQLAYLLEMTAREYKTEQTDVLATEIKPDKTPESLERKPHAKSLKNLKASLGKLHKKNERGETALHLSAIKGDFDFVQSLIKQGADVDAKDYAGWTPLHEACNHGHYKIVRKLLKAGASVNVQGLDNDTPLHDACSNGHLKVINLLMSYGADPLIRNKHGETPLDVTETDEVYDYLYSFLENSECSDASPPEQEVPESFLGPKSSLVTSSSESIQAEFPAEQDISLVKAGEAVSSSDESNVTSSVSSSMTVDQTNNNISPCSDKQNTIVSSQCVNSSNAATSTTDELLCDTENKRAGAQQQTKTYGSDIVISESNIECSEPNASDGSSVTNEQCLPSSSSAFKVDDLDEAVILEDCQSSFNDQIASTSSPNNPRKSLHIPEPGSSENKALSSTVSTSSLVDNLAAVSDSLCSTSTNTLLHEAYSPNDSGYHEESDVLITSLEHSDIHKIEESPLGKMLLHDPNFSVEHSPIDSVTQCLSSCEDSSEASDVVAPCVPCSSTVVEEPLLSLEANETHIERIHRSPSPEKLRVVNLEPCDIVQAVLSSDTLDGEATEAIDVDPPLPEPSHAVQSTAEPTAEALSVVEPQPTMEVPKVVRRSPSPKKMTWRKALRRDTALNYSALPKQWCRLWMLSTQNYQLEAGDKGHGSDNAYTANTAVQKLMKRQRLELEKLQVSLEHELLRIESRCVSVQQQKKPLSACTSVLYQAKCTFHKLGSKEKAEQKTAHLPDLKKLRLAWVEDVIDKYSTLEGEMNQRHQNELSATAATARLRWKCATSRKERLRKILTQ